MARTAEAGSVVDVSAGLFHKTKLCKFNAIGACAKGSACTFAHGSTEMNPLPDFQCTKFCPTMQDTGVCDDPTCRFAHDRNEIRRRKPADVVSTGVPPPPTPVYARPVSSRTSNASESMKMSDVEAAKNPSSFESLLVKTKMCKFNLIGECSKGSACKYAHSQEELMPTPDLSFTKLCPAIVKIGVCEDPGCRFAHSRDELRGSMQDGVQKLTEEALLSAGKLILVRQSSALASNSSDCGVSTNASGLAISRGQISDSWSTSSQLGFESEASTSPSSVDRVSKDLFFKTKMCKFHAKGMCSKGESCSFAHSPEELQLARRTQLAEVHAVPVVPSSEGARVLLHGDRHREYFLAVKNGFFTVDVEDFNDRRGSSKKRSQSLPART